MNAERDASAQPEAGTAAQTEGPRGRFRFHGPLNDLLAPARRGLEFEHRCARAASVKNAIESLGVPHTEVGRALSRLPGAARAAP
jgi:hypothetical protein